MPDQVARPTKVGYIPTLDGWRALAVFSVIFYHDKLWRIGPVSDSFIHNYGSMGVDLFFAISGILICSRLLDEEYTNHQISIRDFYVRRFCRILPPAWLYLGVLAVLGIAHVVHVGLAAWLCSLVFLGNYYNVWVRSVEVSLYTNHFWSLAIEEHFYLILPGILVLFRKHRIAVLVTLIAAFFVYGTLIHANRGWLDFMGGNESVMRTELRINALIFPALLAILLRKPTFNRFSERWLKPHFVIPALIVVFGALFALAVKLHLSNSGLIQTAANFGFPFLIVSTMMHPRTWLSRLLEIAPLRHLGKISYSIYLWHQLFFIGKHTSFGAAWPFNLLQSWPWSMCAVLLIANASFYLVERPFIRLGHRLAPPATPGRRDMEPASR